MTAEILTALALFGFVASITPGPNNMMLMSSGLAFGLVPTLPHMLGVAIGFTVMIFAVGVGLGAAFEAVPQLYTVLKLVSAAYLLVLAWKIAWSGPVGEGGRAGSRPMTFLQAAAFQWVNPKAWVMAVTAIAAYAPKASFFSNVLIVSAVFGIINLPCISAWAMFGTILRRFLHDAQMVRTINMVMALALVASAYPLLAEFLE